MNQAKKEMLKEKLKIAAKIREERPEITIGYSYKLAEEEMDKKNYAERLHFGPQEPPQNEMIFNRLLPDGTRRPISEFFERIGKEE